MRISLFSRDNLRSSIRDTAARFYYVLIFAVIGTFSLLYLNRIESGDTSYSFIVKMAMCCYLALPLMTSLRCLTERMKQAPYVKEAVQLAGIAILVVYYFSLPKQVIEVPAFYIYRFLALITCFHLMASFLPFIGRNEANGFWNFNKSLFLRFLLSSLYTLVLFAGISIAIWAITELFKVTFYNKIYLDLFLLMSGIFNTWFFLSGVPADYTQLQDDKVYPKGLKIFTQYVLLPIVTIYLLILYGYLFKILFSASLPIGWVSNLILAFSVSGMLALLLVHPWQFMEENKWIRLYTRYYYFLLLPLIILMMLAIGRRISDYGITENRYLVAILAVWLLMICVYFIISKLRSIKFVPLSLAILSIIFCLGPLSAFNISLKSQLNHLRKELKQAGMLDDKNPPRVHPNDRSLKPELENAIGSRIVYICSNHGYQKLQNLLQIPLDNIILSRNSKYDPMTSIKRSQNYLSAYEASKAINEYLNVTEHTYSAETAPLAMINCSLDMSRMIDITGYDLLAEVTDNGMLSDTGIVVGEGGKLSVHLKRNGMMLYIQPIGYEEMKLSLSPLTEKLEKNWTDTQNTNYSAEDISLTQQSGHFRIKIVFKYLNFNKAQKSDNSSFSADFFIMLKLNPEDPAKTPD